MCYYHIGVCKLHIQGLQKIFKGTTNWLTCVVFSQHISGKYRVLQWVGLVAGFEENCPTLTMGSFLDA